MNRYMLALAAVIGLGAASCSDDVPGDGVDAKMYGTLKMASITAVVEEQNLGRDVDKSEMVVEIFKGDSLVHDPMIYGEMPEAVELEVGDGYCVKVHSPEPGEDADALGAPYYAGESEEFKIEHNLITEVETIRCTLSNVMVSVEVTEKLLEMLGSAATVEVTFNNETIVIDVENSDKTTAYFDAAEGEADMTAKLTGAMGDKSFVMEEIATVKGGGEHHSFSFTIKTVEG